jgi:hypothetical protein
MARLTRPLGGTCVLKPLTDTCTMIGKLCTLFTHPVHNKTLEMAMHHTMGVSVKSPAYIAKGSPGGND